VEGARRYGIVVEETADLIEVRNGCLEWMVCNLSQILMNPDLQIPSRIITEVIERCKASITKDNCILIWKDYNATTVLV